MAYQLPFPSLPRIESYPMSWVTPLLAFNRAFRVHFHVIIHVCLWSLVFRCAPILKQMGRNCDALHL